jgi:hypothetical protein
MSATVSFPSTSKTKLFEKRSKNRRRTSEIEELKHFIK